MNKLSDLQQYQFLSKFARWNPKKNQRETYQEAVSQRVMPWLKKQIAPRIPKDKLHFFDFLERMFLEQKATPSMRLLQMAGGALDRCHSGLYNCSYLPIESTRDFSQVLYLLMQGVGVGFSVESKYINKLPIVQKFKEQTIKYQVQDTTEGWCDAVYFLILHLYEGYNVEFDLSLIRPQGSRLKTKGGFASGPKPLSDFCKFANTIFAEYQGSKLPPSAVHRLVCFLGSVVVSGGVRRSALISLSDLTDVEMQTIKQGEFWKTDKYWDNAEYLFFSNNSAVYQEKPSKELFSSEWESLRLSGTGERGIFNRFSAIRQLPRSRKGNYDFGTNPCGEIILRPREFCNLSIAIARSDDTVESLENKVIAATIFGIFQSCLTNFGRWVHPDFAKNCKEERLLGVDITGQMDCPLLQFSRDPKKRFDRSVLLNHLRKLAIQVAGNWADILDIPIPAAITTVKPSGDSSVLFDCSSGVSPRFGKFVKRWVRENKDTPIAKMLKSQGVPHAEFPNSQTMVFAFPLRSPKGSITKEQMSAIDQFENWLDWKLYWSEHSVSATIYVGENEWEELGQKVYEHFDEVSGLSFLPRDNGVYEYAPNCEMDEADFAKFEREFPRINWEELGKFENEDMTTGSQNLSCIAGNCEL